VPSADKRHRKKDNARAAREARAAAEKRRKRNRTIRNVVIVTALFVGVFALISFLTRDNSKKRVETTNSSTSTTTAPKVKLTGFVADPKKTYTATIKTNFGTIVVALDAKDAPKAAGRFIELSRAGFYNNTPWSRASKDFVIQGGDPGGQSGPGTGNPPVIGEVPKDHYPVGALAAAKPSEAAAGSFDSQFFIVTGSKGAALPNDYARFGSVKSGLDVAKQIEALAPASGDGPPTKPATIDKITITES
jgi:cyclophilin family peptidyl-prolyl cis-trans isomerase